MPACFFSSCQEIKDKKKERDFKAEEFSLNGVLQRPHQTQRSWDHVHASLQAAEMQLCIKVVRRGCQLGWKSLKCACFSSFWEASPTRRALHTAAARRRSEGGPAAHTHAHASSPAASGNCKHTQVKQNTPCSSCVYALERVLIALNRAFTTQMLFQGLTVHPHTIPPMMHNMHTPNLVTLKQTFLTFLRYRLLAIKPDRPRHKGPLSEKTWPLSCFCWVSGLTLQQWLSNTASRNGMQCEAFCLLASPCFWCSSGSVPFFVDMYPSIVHFPSRLGLCLPVSTFVFVWLQFPIHLTYRFHCLQTSGFVSCFNKNQLSSTLLPNLIAPKTKSRWSFQNVATV